MQRTLVLNAGYEPLHLVSWQRAIVLLFTSKAEIVSEYSGAVRTISSTYALPSVIRLKSYVRIVRKFGWTNCTRKNVLVRDRYTCQYCGTYQKPATITIDHVIPKSKGGLDNWDNLVAACKKCNHKKGNKVLKDSGLKLLRKPRRPVWSDLIHDNRRSMPKDWLVYLDYYKQSG